MSDTTTQDPAVIEREIRRTQDNMSRTVEKIGDQFSVKNLFNALLEKADENDVDARMLIDGARRNPIALGLIAAGAIWLVSDKDSKLPSFDTSDKAGGSDFDDFDTPHRDYVSYMSAVEQRGDEDAMTYQRRRDQARSNFLMIERDHDEDDSSFKQRLDGMTDSFREKRRGWADTASNAQVATKQKAKAAVGKAQDLYTGNPLVGGIIAAAVGAAFASALPITRQEKDKLGGLGEKAREVIDDNKDEVTSQLREKKDELLDRADAALKPSTDTRPSVDAADIQSAEKPFIARY